MCRKQMNINIYNVVCNTSCDLSIFIIHLKNYIKINYNTTMIKNNIINHYLS